jgi:hypothetical protein
LKEEKLSLTENELVCLLELTHLVDKLSFRWGSLNNLEIMNLLKLSEKSIYKKKFKENLLKAEFIT